MNSTPDLPQPNLLPVKDFDDPQTAKSGTEFSLAVSLQHIQAYLAPLETLGKQKVAWIGSILVFIGIFLPTKAASIPFLNITVTASFWDYSKVEASLLILLALASAALAYIRDYKWLWATGAVAMFFLVMELFNALTQSYMHPSWGWLILLPGAALIFAAAAMKRSPFETSGDAVTVVRDLAQWMSQAR